MVIKYLSALDQKVDVASFDILKKGVGSMRKTAQNTKSSYDSSTVEDAPADLAHTAYIYASATSAH